MSWERTIPKEIFRESWIHSCTNCPQQNKRRKLSSKKFVLLKTFGNVGCCDIYSKKAALTAAPSVVNLISYSGNKEKFWCSGFIIKCQQLDDLSGNFSTIVLTLATLVKPRKKSPIADKVVVNVAGGISYQTTILACDFHYNLAAIEFVSNSALQAITLRHVDDYMRIDSNEKSHQGPDKLLPGDMVLALGRYITEPYELMVSSGKFSINSCHLNCKELLRADLKISMCGIGGPVINSKGEAIGISFYDQFYTPFLPVNIVMKWWDHFVKYREFCRPSHGMAVTNLYSAGVDFLAEFRAKFPDIFEGVIVEKVKSGSPAVSSGICANDVIIACNGKSMRSSLEFFEFIWDNSGRPVELGLVRESDGSCQHLSMVVDDAKEKFYRWPLCKLSKIRVKASDSSVITELRE